MKEIDIGFTGFYKKSEGGGGGGEFRKRAMTIMWMRGWGGVGVEKERRKS